ncbi:MFS transporter [Amycolatopsis keratiniphila]|uniref:Chemotaxis protein n=1 Tax=Amycolatopsis keratiniphila subsp. keratiniphila TaxID=227715 RepID=A0A1W2LH97_9PSEU|nr:MFS transporter [Amycolatopsis keratiniphila]OLZ51854.1 chemotaxis protein [Amycolatopsis keratiniphila subsp. nogabecina]ONF62239.1 chemotaxis protein [Amycolatopsis keratiniphila subsp. keratiniphila]SDU62478.1 MFS transporter, DHA1 family, chloramphenicol resistance protein [Amycolatopsis keratiniphila]
MIETKRLPAGVYLLAFSLFAMGSAEFLMAGVLPAVAVDLGVSLSSAGALITAFALGVVLGGPPFAVLSLKWPRRTALMTTQAVFAAAIAVGLLADDYWLLLVTRFVAGLAYAGFFAVAAVTAISLVTPDRNARASGVVVTGLSVAMVAGGPAGTLLSNLTDWTGGFWGVVTLTVVGVIACAVGLPATAPSAEPSLSGELRAMRTPRLWGVYAITILSTAAYMVSFNYLAAMLVDVVPAVWIPAVLALFGIGAFAGLSIGGRISDRRPHHALLGGGAGIAVFSVMLALFATSVWVVVPTVFLLGVAAFVLNPALYGRVFTIAASAPTLAGATTVSAFQLGISLTPAFAAGALNLGASLAAIPWIGAGLALITVALVLVC